MCGNYNEACEISSEAEVHSQCRKSEPKSMINSYGALDDVKNSSNSMQKYENLSDNQNSLRTEIQHRKTDDAVSNRKKFSESDSAFCRIPSTPTLIVSDTNTGKDNCLLESNQLPFTNFNERTDSLSTASTLDSPGIGMTSENMDCGTCPAGRTSNISSDMSAKRESDSQLFMPLKMCDSAYGSSTESRSGAFSPPAYCSESNISANSHNSGNDLSIPAEQHDCNSLSVYVSTPIYSSSSSLASDYVADAESHDSETSVSANLPVNKDVRKLSSSSTFSQRYFGKSCVLALFFLISP